MNAIDANPATFWHSKWTSPAATYPHQVTVDLGSPQPVTALRYLRRTGSTNGDIDGYDVLVSLDGVTWTEAASGTFPAGKGEAEARFAAPLDARYVRLLALSAHNGLQFAAAAELRLLRTR